MIGSRKYYKIINTGSLNTKLLGNLGRTQKCREKLAKSELECVKIEKMGENMKISANWAAKTDIIPLTDMSDMKLKMDN